MLAENDRFEIRTFELCAIIANPTKNRPDGRCFINWLCLTSNFRTDYYNDLIKMAPEIEQVKTMLLT